HAPNVNFFGTVWLRHCPLVDQDSTPGFSGTQGQCRTRLWLYYGEISGLGCHLFTLLPDLLALTHDLHL
ncbi:hypothetical protein, partial [Hydrogenophaga sp.]|uniref:hypothetical protein n=1 Tax=Hydrogenophaga sp. TaxID=1904254 RepID=UPI001AC9826B